DAGQYWLPLFHSSSVGSTNWSGLKDETLDNYIDTVNVTVDKEERKVLFQKIWDRLDELHPFVVLAVPNELYGVREDLVGAEDFYDGRLNYLGNIALKD
ncbi:MAG TPA: DNA-binding protein, partial [Aminobacterium sp.]|nr:DNA-binding protein [Aminobacterium sp.]